MERKTSANFFAVIPAQVLMDKDLRPNAKLLYAVISNLCNARGYCWATNEELGSPLEIAGKTVSSLVSQLVSHDLIRVQLIRDPKSNEITERRIWLQMPRITIVADGDTPPEDMHEGMLKNEHTLCPELSTPMLKNGEENNININKIPPKAPLGGRRSKRAPKALPDWKPERFSKFWDYYRTHCRGESKQAAIRAWDRLKPNDDLIDIMGKALQKQIQSPEWQAGIGIPYASTWLNNQRWLDEPKAASGTVEANPAPIKEGWN